MPKFPVDAGMLDELKDEYGISEVRAIKALYCTENKGVEDALLWLDKHKHHPQLDKDITLGHLKELKQSLLETGGNAAASSAAAAGTAGDVTMTPAEGGAEGGAPASGGQAPLDANDVPGEENPAELKEKINQGMLGELTGMGFGPVRAEKALWFTASAGLEPAINWLTEHAEDGDIDIPLAQNALKQTAPKPKMSKEEAMAKAMALQKRLKEEREAREKVEAIERERARIEGTKKMQETQKKLEEQERIRALEQLKREKEAHEAEKKRQKELLKRDWEERFGKPYPEEGGALEEGDAEADIMKKSGKEQVIFFVNKLKKNYKDTNKDGLKTCLTTIRLYCDNAAKNPTDAKFHKIKKENAAFKTRVAPFDGAVQLLNSVGFKDDGEFYAIKGCPDGFLCGQAIKFIDVLLSTL